MKKCLDCNFYMREASIDGQHPFEIGVDGKTDIHVHIPTGEKGSFLGMEIDKTIKEEEPVEEVVVDVVGESQPDDNELDILKQIQQMKQDVPSADDEEDAELIEKIKQLLDEFN